jgi:integrase
LGLGSFPEVSLGEARENVSRIKREFREAGRLLSPRERRRSQRRIPTFREAAAKAHGEKKEAWKSGKHQDQWLSTLEAFAYPHLGDLPVNEIDGPTILRALSPIWLRVPETARRVRQRIAAVLDWSHAHGFRDTEAPMRAVGKGLPAQPKKDGHFEAMPYPDLPAFMTKVRSEAETIGRMALQFTILNAARSGETRGALWSEIDFEKRTWTVPAQRMKGGRAHVVPLSDPAMEILTRRSEARQADVDMIFSGAKGKPLSDMTLTKILRDGGLGCTVHGFRSSFRDWAAETMSMPGEVAEAALAHSVPNKVEAAYRRTNFLDQRRLLMQAWADFLGGKSNVVALAGRPRRASATSAG